MAERSLSQTWSHPSIQIAATEICHPRFAFLSSTTTGSTVRSVSLRLRLARFKVRAWFIQFCERTEAAGWPALRGVGAGLTLMGAGRAGACFVLGKPRP